MNGIILKTDTLGSLEAIAEMLRVRQIPIKRADIGPVTRRDVVEASAVKKNDKYHGVVLAFGVKLLSDAEQEVLDSNVKIFSDQIIYNLLDGYLDWLKQEQEQEQKAGFDSITPLCKFRFMKGFSFRRNDPAVFGVEIVEGKLRQKSNVMNETGKIIGVIHQIQDEGKTIAQAERGRQVAVSMTEPTIGRQVNEGDVLYSIPSEFEIKAINTKYLNMLGEDDRSLLETIIRIRRKSVATYGY